MNKKDVEYVNFDKNIDLKVPEFESIIENFYITIFRSELFKDYKYVESREFFFDCKDDCYDNYNDEENINKCIKECHQKLNDFSTPKTGEVYKKYENQVIREIYNRQLTNIKDVIDKKIIYRHLLLDDPVIFIEDLTSVGKTQFQRHPNKCQFSENKYGVGVSWTPYKEKAESYWGDGDYDVYLTAKLDDYSKIDTLNTILSEIIYQGREGEVSLLPDKKIDIIEIEYEDPETKEKKIINGCWNVYI